MREDVLTGMNAPDGGYTGFQKYANIAAIAPRKYRLLLVFDDGGTSYICDKGRMVVVQ